MKNSGLAFLPEPFAGLAEIAQSSFSFEAGEQSGAKVVGAMLLVRFTPPSPLLAPRECSPQQVQPFLPLWYMPRRLQTPVHAPLQSIRSLH